MIEVDGKSLQWIKDMSVTDLLNSLENEEFCSVVRLNGKLVSSPKFDQTPIPDQAVIELLPLVAGG